MVHFNKYLAWTLLTTFVFLEAVTNVNGFPVAQRHWPNRATTTTESNSKTYRSNDSLSNASSGTQMTTSEVNSTAPFSPEEGLFESTIMPTNSSPIALSEQNLNDEQKSIGSANKTSLDLQDTEYLTKEEQLVEKTTMSPTLTKEEQLVEKTTMSPTLTKEEQLVEKTTMSPTLTKEEQLVEKTTMSPTRDPHSEGSLYSTIHSELKDMVRQHDGFMKLMDSIPEASALHNNNNNDNNNKRSIEDVTTKPVTPKDQIKVFSSMFWLAFSFTRDFSIFRQSSRLSTDTTPEVQESLGKDVTKTIKSVDITETTTQNNNDAPETTTTTKATEVKIINCTTDDGNCRRGSVVNIVPVVPAPVPAAPAPARERTRVGLDGKLVPSDILRDFLEELKCAKKTVNSTLDITCSKIPADQFPAGMSDCRSFAESDGSSNLPCDGSVTTTHINKTASASDTLLKSMEAISDHYELLETVSELHNIRYPHKIPCEDIKNDSTDHIRCKLDAAMMALKRLRTWGMEMITDIGVNEAPRTFVCQVDLSIQQKFPLGPLWRVQHDLGEIYSNIKAISGNNVS